jgi:hypothetical protein
MKKYSRVFGAWFWLGLGSQMQPIASLSFSELFVLIAGPFLFLKNHSNMKRDGVATFFNLSVLMVLGCWMSCTYNHTFFGNALRGYAIVCIVMCAIPVAYWLLKNDPIGFKWYLLGFAISKVLCTFVFQQTFEITTYAGGNSGDGAADLIMNGPIYWIGRLKPFVVWPTQAFFLKTPILLDACAFLFMGMFSMLVSSSGRAAALTSFAAVGLLLIGGKRVCTMRRVSKYFILLVCMGIVFIWCSKMVYYKAAESGLLGEESREKYEKQTRSGGGILNLLMAGRSEVFIGLSACIENPIFGKGPWAIDDEGYIERFLYKYGSEEDIVIMDRTRRDMERMGIGRRISFIPCHSHIAMLWLSYGFPGLLFILYCILVLLRFLMKDCYIVPQWFGWIVCANPGMFWHICFSGFADRLGFPIFIVTCLMARAVRKGTFVLPIDMQDEIYCTDRRTR